MAAKVKTLVSLLKRQPTRTNERGNVIHDFFGPAERYLVDFAEDFTSEGWAQFDTDQDAHYFGVWVNRRQRLTLTYAEGDWSLVVCPDGEHYRAEVRDMIEFYGEGRVARVIGENGSAVDVCQDRAIFLADSDEGQVTIGDVLQEARQ